MTESENPVGQWGIERQYEAELAGSAGRIVRAANSSGGELPVEAEQYVPAQDGNSVVLTIDSTIQETLEKQLETALADNPRFWYRYGCKNRRTAGTCRTAGL